MRRLESGIPLGGIGAGKIEFCADGRFTNVTTNNNWDTPIVDGKARSPAPPRIKEGFPGSVAENASRRRSIYSAEGVPGAWMALHTPQHGAKVLKTVGRPAFSTVPAESIAFDGRFPIARVTYQGFAPLSVTLEAFSSLDLVDASPDYIHSALPLALFHFRIRNLGRESIPLSLAFSWQNLNGIGGYPWDPINQPDPTAPRFRQEDETSGLWFTHEEKGKVDRRVVGDYSLRVWSDHSDAVVSHCAGWDPEGDGHDVWDLFAGGGNLAPGTVHGTAGALAVGIELAPEETSSVVFALAWYFPHLLGAVSEWENLVGTSHAPPRPDWLPHLPQRPDYGHAYSRWFKDSWGIAEYGLRHWKELYRRTASWQASLSNSSLPSRATIRFCNDLFPLFANTWYTHDYRYAVNEAPTDMKGCLGTIDQRAVANAAVACAFPKLDRSELALFAADQIRAKDERRYGFHWNTRTGRFALNLDREGAILHDIGWDHLEGGRIGKQGWLSAHWPDLTSVFVLQAYQHAIWNGSVEWLNKIYPHVQAALRFQARLDQNGNGLPDLWGSGCCTYDTELYPYYGASSFVATLYLAALRAAEKMSELQQDHAFAETIRARFARAQQAVERELWDESRGYYLSWRDRDHEAWDGTPMAHGQASPNCHIAQVAGGWWADLLCLGEIVDPGRRRRALQSIDRLNVQPVPGCPANEAAPDGSYSESWPAYAIAYYAAQAIAAGLADEGWRAIERIVQVYEADGSFWDTPLEWAGEGNRRPQWGRWYMSNPASMVLLLALSGIRLDLLHRFLVCTPSWPAAWGDTLRMPAFLPGIELAVICERKPKDWSLIVRAKQIAREPLELRECISRLPRYLDPGRVRITLSGIPDAEVGLQDDRRILIRGAIRLSREGDGFELSARAV